MSRRLETNDRTWFEQGRAETARCDLVTNSEAPTRVEAVDTVLGEYGRGIGTEEFRGGE